MKRKHRFLAIGAMALLLIALCLPVLSGALAAGEEEPLIVPIGKNTEVLGEDGLPIGTLMSNQTFVPVTGESPSRVIVIYDHAAANKATKSDILAGKTLVLLRYGDGTAATEPTTEAAAANLPTQGRIDANLVVIALSAQHAVDANTIASKEAIIDSLENAANGFSGDSGEGGNAPVDDKSSGIFSAEKTEVWVPVAAIILGILGLGVLVWVAVSASTSAWESERTVRQLTKLNERLAEGMNIKTPLRIEQIAWPREGHVQLAPNVMDQLAAVAIQGSIYNSRYQEPEIPVVVEPVRIPEGEEPDLLQLANRLAGIASAAEWHAIVKDAGWKAALLQANPTEKGTFIADDSGYSIIACLMRTPDADLGYVLPSYQDPNASERRWMEFYSVNENNSVRNFRVDALAVVHIERGTFYLPKSNGRLTRRKQEF